MNQRGGSCEWLRDSTKLAFRKVFGLLLLAAILAFSRSARAQGGSLIIEPISGDYTNFYPYPFTNGALLWSPFFGTNGGFNGGLLGYSNIAIAPPGSTVGGLFFSNLYGGIIPTNLVLQIVTWTGAPSSFI